MGRAVGLAKETPHTPPPETIKGIDKPKSLHLRTVKFLRALEQTVIGELIALTSSKNHLE